MGPGGDRLLDRHDPALGTPRILVLDADTDSVTPDSVLHPESVDAQLHIGVANRKHESSFVQFDCVQVEQQDNSVLFGLQSIVGASQGKPATCHESCNHQCIHRVAPT